MHLKKLFGKDTDKVVALCIDMYEQRTNNPKLYSVCKFHHTRIEWCGIDAVCQPDKWVVYRNGTRYLLNVDAIRCDGICARLKKL